MTALLADIQAELARPGRASKRRLNKVLMGPKENGNG